MIDLKVSKDWSTTSPVDGQFALLIGGQFK